MTHDAYSEEDPRYHTTAIKEKLDHISKQARENVARVNDLKAKVLLKTTADLISGLTSVYEDYAEKRRSTNPLPEDPAEPSKRNNF